MKREPIDGLRVPPHSIESEHSILGGLMMDNTAYDRAAELVSEDDFYTHDHRIIWRAISSLIVARKAADVVTVYERLGKQADEVGGLQYLNAMAQSVPSASNIRRYAEIVRERAMQRRLIAAAENAASLAWAGGPMSETLDQIAAQFDAIARVGQKSAPQEIGSLMVAAMDRYSDMSEGKFNPSMPTQMRQLDRLLGGGLKDGRLYGLAARPSVGKSSSARSIGIRVARQGKPVLILSQEMPKDEQADCVIAELGRIDSERLQSGEFSDGDWGRIAEAVDEAKALPLYFDEQGSLTIADIRTKARSVKNLRLLVVDYLQLCAATSKGKTTNDEVAEISKGLKALALEMRIPIIVLSQLNREVEKRADKEPQLSDLRDSGAIEQDLDVAILLWTLEEDENTSRRKVGWKVAKNRGGRKGRFAMLFDAPVYGWEDCEWPQRQDKPRTGANL